MKTRRSIFLLAWLALLPLGPATARPQQPPAAIVTVLVDLSQTWHNAASLGRNRRLLAAVGGSIADAQAGLPKPIQVHYRIIGQNSLLREAFYMTRFAPSLMGGASATVATNANVFRNRLAGPSHGWSAAAGPTSLDPVPLTMLRLPPEQKTEIMAAVIAARRADALAASDSVRIVIVLSDFVEDSQGAYALTDSLKGYQFVLIGRVLPQDAQDPGALPQRMQAFKAMLHKRYAKVRLFEESAVLQSPADFAHSLDEMGRQ